MGGVVFRRSLWWVREAAAPFLLSTASVPWDIAGLLQPARDRRSVASPAGLPASGEVRAEAEGVSATSQIPKPPSCSWTAAFKPCSRCGSPRRVAGHKVGCSPGLKAQEAMSSPSPSMHLLLLGCGFKRALKITVGGIRKHAESFGGSTWTAARRKINSVLTETRTTL